MTDLADRVGAALEPWCKSCGIRAGVHSDWCEVGKDTQSLIRDLWQRVKELEGQMAAYHIKPWTAPTIIEDPTARAK